MAFDLTDEQKALGIKNFEQASADLERARQAKNDPTRRTFMKTAAAAGAVVPVSAAVYFGYDQWKGNKAIKVALIGTGDEGGILVGDHNPEYTNIVAVCDIRPSSIERIFEGEKQPHPRKGLNLVYGKDEAKSIKVYTDVKDLLADKDSLELDAVIIATPLFTHHTIAIQCMEAGLHVLCEKLMARTIADCKAMITAAKKNGVLLSIGHQRHYSMLYAHATEVVQSGVLGEINHIRALWHRNNSWPFAMGDKSKWDMAYDLPFYRDSWYPPIQVADTKEYTAEEVADMRYQKVNGSYHLPKRLAELGYTDMPELIRWRTYDKTGGGLMAELGSHQLDAASIFLGKVKPLAVLGSGVKSFYSPGKNDRECEDGVFVTFEFPGATHPKAGKGGTNQDDIVVVTYSSFNTNGFEKYGECLMGNRGTMIVEEEKEVYLFKEPEPGKKDSGGRSTNVTVSTSGAKPAMEASSTWGGGGAATISKGSNAPKWDTDIRGYRSEMEHFAFCVRQWGDKKVEYTKENGKFKNADMLPRCHGEIAMADAILALTANLAMKHRERINFDENWFDPENATNPEDKYAKKA